MTRTHDTPTHSRDLGVAQAPTSQRGGHDVTKHRGGERAGLGWISWFFLAGCTMVSILNILILDTYINAGIPTTIV